MEENTNTQIEEEIARREAAAEMEKTRAELEAKIAAFEREKLKYETAKTLGEKKLPVEFAEYLIAEDEEKTAARIKKFEAEYLKAVESAVNEKLKGSAPPSGNATIQQPSFMKAIFDNQIKRR